MALQGRDFGFKRGDACVTRGKRCNHISGLDPPRNVLGAVHVPGRNGEQQYPVSYTHLTLPTIYSV